MRGHEYWGPMLKHNEPEQNGVHFADTIFKNIPQMKIFELR